MWVNVTRVFWFFACYFCLILRMLTKKHISAFVYVAITFIMLFGVQQLEKSCSVQRSWECKGQICNVHPTRPRCNRALTSIYFYNWHKWLLRYHATCFIMWQYHMDLITVKESNRKNKVHVIKSHYMVTCFNMYIGNIAKCVIFCGIWFLTAIQDYFNPCKKVVTMLKGC